MPGITAPQRPRRSRKPTGLPNPPMILLAGPEKTGKSRKAAEGTASELLGMTYWIEVGGSEGTADYYGRLPGANYEIVEHDGSYQDILDAVRWAVAQPPAVEGKRNMIVVDNVSVLWDMLSDEQALYARWRAERNAKRDRRPGPNPNLPVTVDPDLWNRAKDRWGEILWHLRRHSGPTLLLARQELVTAFENDKPTRDRTRKIKAEKNLPAAVDAIVELHAMGEAYLTGVRTLHWEVAPGESERFDNFSIDALLRRMGYEEAAVTRQVTEVRPEAYLEEQAQQQRQAPAQQQRQRQQQRPSRQEQAPRQQQPQRPPATPQDGQRPKLTGELAVALIRKALESKDDPAKAIQDLRWEWGVSTLREVMTSTPWGDMSADALALRSIKYAQERAAQKQQAGEDASGEQQGAGEQTGASSTASPGPEGPEQAREHQAHAEEQRRPTEEQEPPAEDDAPPPPDPEQEEPPAERVEDVTEAEEPQDIPPPRRESRGMAIARKALMAEAEIQARLKFVTVGVHLGPITEEGDPAVTTLKDYLVANRPPLIRQLIEEGHEELAEAYRTSKIPEMSLPKLFEPYFAGALTGRAK